MKAFLTFLGETRWDPEATEVAKVLGVRTEVTPVRPPKLWPSFIDPLTLGV